LSATLQLDTSPALGTRRLSILTARRASLSIDHLNIFELRRHPSLLADFFVHFDIPLLAPTRQNSISISLSVIID
jgi:hypothetical protein